MRRVVLFVLSLMAMIVIAQVHGVEAHHKVVRSTSRKRRTAEELRTKLRQVLRKAENDALETLNDAKNQLNEVVDKTRNEAKEKIQDIEKGFKDRVDKLKENAKDANIDECFNDKDKLDDLLKQISDDTESCISDNANQATEYLDNGVNRIKTIVDRIDNIRSEIRECIYGSRKLRCMAELITKIERDIAHLPGKIRSDVADRALNANKLQVELGKCTASKIGQGQSESEKILEEISACVDKKIGKSDQSDANDGTTPSNVETTT